MRAGVLKSPHAGMFQFSGNAPDTATALNTLYREQERRKRVLGWRRTHKDPFAGEWEQITAWLVANPQRSSGDVFRELQRRFPGRYQPLQIRTLQRGMRKIRAYVLQTFEEQWQEEVIHGRSPPQSCSRRRPSAFPQRSDQSERGPNRVGPSFLNRHVRLLLENTGEKCLKG